MENHEKNLKQELLANQRIRLLINFCKNPLVLFLFISFQFVCVEFLIFVVVKHSPLSVFLTFIMRYLMLLSVVFYVLGYVAARSYSRRYDASPSYVYRVKYNLFVSIVLWVIYIVLCLSCFM